MKITKRQLRRIIREEYKRANQDYLLNEGFLDFMKKLGGDAIDGVKKQQAAADDYKAAWKAELEKLGEYDEAEVEKIVKSVKDQARKSRGELFNSIGHMGGLEDETGTVDIGIQGALLAYAWNDLVKGT